MKPRREIARPGEDFLNVVGNDGDRCRDEERDRAGVGDRHPGFVREQREAPADEVDAGGDHRRRVNQCTDWRRPFHRVREPDLERELGRLADAAEEHAQPGDYKHPIRHCPIPRSLQFGLLGGIDDEIIGEVGDWMEMTGRHGREQHGVRPGGRDDHRARFVRPRRCPHDLASQLAGALAVRIDQRGANLFEDVLEVERTDERPQDHKPDDEAGIADAVGDERFVRRIGRTLPLVVEADQQV